MKKLLVAATALAMAVPAVMGVPAKRGLIQQRVQPDGTVVELQLIGDEHAHIYMTTDRLPVMEKADGSYCFATLDASGNAVISDVVALNPADRSASQRAFAATIDVNTVANKLLNRQSPMRVTSSSGVGIQGSLFPHEGSPRALVILAQYSGSAVSEKFQVPEPHQYFDDFLNKEGFSQHKGTGSVRDFFIASSAGQFTPQFDVYGPVTLPYNSSYYGSNDVWGNDKKAGDMVYDACRLLDDEINFADYDINGDGYVDNVYIIYAGRGEASGGASTTIWPHRWKMTYAYGSTPEFDGVKIQDYGCCNEWEDGKPDGIGTFCHEFSHVMGLPDLYSTQYDESSLYITPGSWSVLDYGPYNNDSRTPPVYSAFERNAMGWIDPIVIDDAASITLPNIHDNNVACIIQTSNPNEFFLLENRQQTGWDKYLPGHGMLVWHIDYNRSVWENNSVNNSAYHQYVDIEEANGLRDNSDYEIMAGYPFPGTSRVTSFTNDTKPSMKTWANVDLGLPITDITEKGGIITFDVAGGKVDLVAPVAVASDATGNSFTLTWEEVPQATSYLVNIYEATPGEDVPVASYVDFEVKANTAVIERLKPNTMYHATVTAKRGSYLSPVSETVAISTTDATFDMLVAQALEASDITENSFTACWEPLEGAADYRLTVIAESMMEEQSDYVNFGTGLKLGLPQGWTSSASDVYTSSSYVGQNIPSLKLSKMGHYLESPLYEGDVLSFEAWMRSAGTTHENYIELLGLVPPVSGAVTDDDWVLIYSRVDVNNAVGGEIITVNDIPAGVKKIRLVYNKVVSGNLAVDDVVVTIGGTKTDILEGYDNLSVGNVTSHALTNLSGGTGTYIYTVTAIDENGVESLPSDPVFVTLSDNNAVVDAVNSTSVVNVHGDNITVIASEGTPVTVTDIAGRCVGRATAPADFTVAPGFYIVTAGNDAHKIQVK